MFHRETFVYREPDEIRAENEFERGVAAAVLLQAFIDYHTAKKLIKSKKVSFERYFTLEDYEKQVIRAGKSAYEWFKNKPLSLKRKTGWTLEDCCGVLKFSPAIIRETYISVSAFRSYLQNKNYLMNTENINGERNGRAKLNEDQVREIIKKYASGGKSQESISREYNISQRMVSDIVNGKRWAHVA